MFFLIIFYGFKGIIGMIWNDCERFVLEYVCVEEHGRDTPGLFSVFWCRL